MGRPFSTHGKNIKDFGGMEKERDH
jgi:hypothetical protein